MSAPSVPLLEFLEALELAGFHVGVDDHLRVNKLIGLESEWDLAKLRIALRAILTCEAREREEFDAAFDAFFGGADAQRASQHESSAESAEPKPEPAAPRSALRYFFASAITFALLLVLLLWPDSSTTISQSSDAALGSALSQTSPTSPSSPADAGPPLGNTLPLAETVDAGLAQEPALAQASTEPPAEDLELPKPDEADPSTAEDESRTPVRAALLPTGAGVLGLLLAAFLLLATRRRQGAFVPGPWRYQRKVPLEEIAPTFSARQIEDGAAQLTWQSQEQGRSQVDVERTITATVAAGGFATLVYRPPPAAPEYVVLQDEAPHAEAWQGMYDELFDRLAAEGVRLRRYRFDEDPNFCTTLVGNQSVTLAYLAEHSDGLIVIGDGRRGFDPLENEAPAWVETIASFPNRLWLNPLPKARWSEGAHHIAEQTPMEHGSVAAMAALNPGADQRRHTPNAFPAVIERSPGSAVALGALREHLGASAYRCLALAAVAGAPRADEARWLASRFELALDDEDWLRLLSLPCFAVGSWPDDMRAALISDLRADDSQAELRAQEAVQELLEKSEPIEGSAAHLRWRFDLALQQVGTGDTKASRELEALVQTPLHGAVQIEAAAQGLRLHNGRGARSLAGVSGLVLAFGLWLLAPFFLFADSEEKSAEARTAYDLVSEFDAGPLELAPDVAPIQIVQADGGIPTSLEERLALLRSGGFAAAAEIVSARMSQESPKMALTDQQGFALAGHLLQYLPSLPASARLLAAMPSSTVELVRAVAERGLPTDEAERIATYLARLVVHLDFGKLEQFDSNHSHVIGREWPEIDYSGEGKTWSEQREYWSKKGVSGFKTAANIHSYFSHARKLKYFAQVYAPSNKWGTFSLDENKVESVATAAPITEIPKKYMAEVRSCHQKVLIAHPDMGGRVVLRFTVAQNGRVSKFRVQGFDSEIDQCIKKKSAGWRFPMHSASESTTYRVPITLKALAPAPEQNIPQPLESNQIDSSKSEAQFKACAETLLSTKKMKAMRLNDAELGLCAAQMCRSGKIASGEVFLKNMKSELSRKKWRVICEKAKVKEEAEANARPTFDPIPGLKVDDYVPTPGIDLNLDQTSTSGKKSSTSGKQSLPTAPSRADIVRGIKKVRGRVESCAGKRRSKGAIRVEGTIKVRIVIGGDGTVKSAKVTGAGSSRIHGCVSKAVKRATFPKTQKGATVTYPFVLNTSS